MKLLSILLQMVPLIAVAFDLQLSKNAKFVDVQAIDVPIPVQELESDLKTGLSTNLIATLNIWNKDQVVARVSQQAKIRYDLWDEIYVLQKTLSDKKSYSLNVKKSEMLTGLSKFEFPAAFKVDDFRPGEFYINFVLAIDPVSKDKRQKIRKWLAQNQVASSPGQPSPSANRSAPDQGPTGGTKNRGLFGQVLDTELGDDIDSAKWTYVSPPQPISFKELKNEK